jgi:hypothetical protein
MVTIKHCKSDSRKLDDKDIFLSDSEMNKLHGICYLEKEFNAACKTEPPSPPRP